MNNFLYGYSSELLTKIRIDGKKINRTDNRIVWALVNEAFKRSSSDITITRDILLSENPSLENVRTISRSTKRLEEWGIVTITRPGFCTETKGWLPNTYHINWDVFFTHFGDVLNALKGKAARFISQLKSQFLSCLYGTLFPSQYGQFCPTLKTQEEEKKTTYRLAEAHLYVPKEEKKFNLLTEKEESPSMIEPATDEISILKAHEPTKKHSFDITMRDCPETYRAIAIKEGIHSDWVDEEYEEFMRYWIGVAKTARGKKSDWPATWRNWVRSQVHDFRRKYKLKSRPFDADSTPCNVNNVKIDVNYYNDSVIGVVNKLRKKIGNDVFKSWFDVAIFIPCKDGYQACYQEKHSFIQHTAAQRFKNECEELNIYVTSTHD